MAIWTTPPATVPPKELAIGEVNFGVESRMFVFAYQSSDTTGAVTDTSIPAYNKLVDFTDEERKQYTAENNILILPNDIPNINTTDVSMKYKDKGVTLDTGLRISSNGQIVGTLQVPDQQKNIIFKAQCIDPPKYEKGVVFRSYSHVNYNGRAYRLRAGAPTPFTPDVDVPAAEFWEDIGKYTPQFSDRPPYTVGNRYQAGDYVVHGDILYQLNNKNTYLIRATSAAPDPEYWVFVSNYSVDKHNPPTTYSPTTQFTANNGADGVYVQLDGTVYKLRQPLPYTPKPNDFSPNLAEWDVVGSVAKTQYTVNDLYQLKNTAIYNNKVYQVINTMPYKASTWAPDAEFWMNMGKFTSQTFQTRIFRIVINAQRGSMIEFETGQYLPNLRIGEQLGELRINDIVASSSSLTTYTVAENMIPVRGNQITPNSNGYPYLPKGLTLALDGRLCGRPKGPTGTYYFDVQAHNDIGLTKHQRFYLTIVDGYTESTFSCIGKLSQIHEREWYKMITSNPFDNVEIYRASDPNYGIRTKPEIVLKDNVLGILDINPLHFNTAVAYLKTKLYQEPLVCRVGNLRYRTALDINGTPLYDYVYKELVPLNTYVTYDTKGYLTPPRVPLLDSLKEFIVDTLGSDDDKLTLPLSYLPASTGTKMYLDACPLWQTNPQPFATVKAAEFPTIPVAYLAPGEGQKLIDSSTEDDQLKSMFYNKTIAVETIVFKHHTDEFDREISVTLKSR